MEEQKVRLGPTNPIWKKIFLFFIIFIIIDIICILLSCNFYAIFSNKIWNTIFYKINIFFKNYNIIFIFLLIINILLAILIHKLKLTPPKFDNWVKDIAYKRLSCDYIFYNRKMLFFEYDVSLKKKDISEFITEISDKSNRYTYYLNKIDINNYVASVIVTKKEEIPERCEINKDCDNAWNIIPMGLAVNNDRKCISSVGWMLNDNIKKSEMVQTLPSTSLVIAGGTGSGKSVVENGIIGHITRFPDNIQGLLADVKQVEFGGLEDYCGIHKVALTVAETSELLTQTRNIMYNRFSFMKDNGINNIYKLKGKITVDYYEINGKKYQFDEIFNVNINGQMKLLTMDKIYEEIENGSDVEIEDKFL